MKIFRRKMIQNKIIIFINRIDIKEGNYKRKTLSRCSWLLIIRSFF